MTRARHQRQRRASHRRARILGVVIFVGAMALLGLQTWKSLQPTPSSSTLVSPSTTLAPVTTTTPSPLTQALQRLLESRSGRVEIAALNLTSGQRVNVGATTAQVEASVVKVEILAALLAQSRARGVTLTSRERALAQEMIEASDNTAATQLWSDVGATRGMARFGQSAGLSRTTPSSCVLCTGFPWPGWGLSTTTPQDQLTLLGEIVHGGHLWSEANRHYILHLMESVIASERWGVSAGVPATATVALKNGWLPLNTAGTNWQINSVGWVRGRGRDYLLAMMSTDNASEQYGIDTLNDAARLVWRFE